MFKILAASLVVFFAGISAHATSTPITFGIDCMIHDQQGRMLADLGMVGAMMGNYMPVRNFQYNGLNIEANLNGPFLQTPEVASPQIKLTVSNAQGAVLASLVANANPEFNSALLIPGTGLYLHCDKMTMRH